MTSSGERPTRLEAWMPLMRERLAAGQRVIFQPMGTSMLPLLRQGVDSVELSPAPEVLKKYDLPLYVREDGSYVLHRIVAAGEHYTCMGDNQFCREYPVRREQILAVVTAVLRGSRRIPVTALSYRLYCRLWHFTRFPRRVLRAVSHRLTKLIKKAAP